MEKTITQPVLVIKGNRGLSIFVVVMFTLLTGGIGFSLRTELFDWAHFNPAGLNTILFLLFAAAMVFSWLTLFIDPPRLKIDATGIWKRKHLFSHSLRLVVPWNNISYYASEVIPSQTIPTENLVVRKKEPDEPVTIGITDSDKSRAEILDVLKTYSERYGFNNFVEELNSVPVEG